jgi:hypothetical protein
MIDAEQTVQNDADAADLSPDSARNWSHLTDHHPTPLQVGELAARRREGAGDHPPVPGRMGPAEQECYATSAATMPAR